MAGGFGVSRETNRRFVSECNFKGNKEERVCQLKHIAAGSS